MSDGMVGENFEAPDLIEHIVAFRHWRLKEGSDQLVGPYSMFPWEREMTAVCQATPRSEPGDHEAPRHGCHCGLYGYYGFDKAAEWGVSELVYGAIKAWGRIEVHITGFRAEHAEILCIADGPNYTAATLQDIATRYGVPLVPKHELRAFALEHGTPVPKSLLQVAQLKNAELMAERERKAREWREQQQVRLAEMKKAGVTDEAIRTLRFFWGLLRG